MDDMNTGMGNGAISVYQNDTADDFPVLKAFQQYIDAEQAKARKRMIMLCVFFCFIMIVVISVFAVFLVSTMSRNQSLNDRLIEYAMQDRNRPVPSQQDNAALRSLANKLEDLEDSLNNERKRSMKAAAEHEEASSKAKGASSSEALEIEKLKILLAVEKQKAAAEREKLRQAELEAYRRRQYPELYEEKKTPAPAKPATSEIKREAEAADREIESIIREIEPVKYFDEEEEDDDHGEIRGEKAADIKIKTSRVVKDNAGNDWEMPLE